MTATNACQLVQPPRSHGNGRPRRRIVGKTIHYLLNDHYEAMGCKILPVNFNTLVFGWISVRTKCCLSWLPGPAWTVNCWLVRTTNWSALWLFGGTIRVKSTYARLMEPVHARTHARIRSARFAEVA